MITNKQSQFLKFFKEVAIVVIGVLIAVSINKIKENIDNSRYINKTLNTIEKEISYSKLDLEQVLKKHYILADSVKAKIDKEEALIDIIFGLGGIQGAETKNIGLRFFIANKADLIDYEMISQLLEIEGGINLIDEKMKRLIDFTFSVPGKKDRLNKEKFLLHLNNLINTERGVLKMYSEFSYEN